MGVLTVNASCTTNSKLVLLPFCLETSNIKYRSMSQQATINMTEISIPKRPREIKEMPTCHLISDIQNLKEYATEEEPIST